MARHSAPQQCAVTQQPCISVRRLSVWPFSSCCAAYADASALLSAGELPNCKRWTQTGKAGTCVWTAGQA